MSEDRITGMSGDHRAAGRMGWRVGPGKAKIISVAVYPDDLAWMRQRAAELRMSLSQMLRVMVRRQMRLEVRRGPGAKRA